MAMIDDWPVVEELTAMVNAQREQLEELQSKLATEKFSVKVLNERLVRLYDVDRKLLRQKDRNARLAQENRSLRHKLAKLGVVVPPPKPGRPNTSPKTKAKIKALAEAV